MSLKAHWSFFEYLLHILLIYKIHAHASTYEIFSQIYYLKTTGKSVFLIYCNFYSTHLLVAVAEMQIFIAAPVMFFSS